MGPAGPGADAQAEKPPVRALPGRGGGDQVVNLADDEEGEEDREERARVA